MKTALIVEDSPTQAMHLEELLAAKGMKTLWARTAEEGLHLAQLHVPNIIVLDIELPGMNGMELCKRLKQWRYTKSIPVILMTHLSHQETAKYGIRSEAINFIPKDAFSDAVLIQTLKVQGMI